MIVRDRDRLTRQSLESLEANTDKDSYNLTIVDDGSGCVASSFAQARSRLCDNVTLVQFWKPIGIIGYLKNVGSWTSQRYFGKGDWLYFSDNDVYFTKDWLPRLISSLHYPWLRCLGGQRHPFHQPNETFSMLGCPSEKTHLTDAVAGYSQFMTWETWDKYGPFDQHAKGVCQSEDFAFCQKIIKDGGMVGYVDPPVIYHCGLTNSEGKPAIGSEQFERVPGVYYE